jgi:predicted hotdog family 3-hydroxylacyl-ACP dehydratase
MNSVMDIPSGGAYFEGHFPGRPILPGVAQLTLILDELARHAGHRVLLQGIAFARLRQLVLPGDGLELETRETEAGRLRIDVRRRAALVTNAEFVLGAPVPCSTGPGLAMRAMLDPIGPRIEELLPHRPPMRFVTAIVRETAKGLTCLACVPAACAMVSGGSAPAVVTIEAAAQAAAGWEALQRWRNMGTAAPRLGYLVALRDVVFFADRIPADRPLLVSVSLEAAAIPLTRYLIEISLDGALITRGTISTFLAEDGAR